MTYSVYNHPLLHSVLFISKFNAPVGSQFYPELIKNILQGTVQPPVTTDESVRSAIRELLRYGGYKPAGRGKPSSEYLIRVSSESSLPQINLAVDIGNIISLHSGLPVSVLDLSKIAGSLSIKIASEDEHYIFNQSGQQMDLAGLLCLYDTLGPCANAVKDSQRTKTDLNTSETLTVIWGSNDLKSHVENSKKWYFELLNSIGAQIELVTVENLQ